MVSPSMTTSRSTFATLPSASANETAKREHAAMCTLNAKERAKKRQKIFFTNWRCCEEYYFWWLKDARIRHAERETPHVQQALVALQHVPMAAAG